MARVLSFVILVITPLITAKPFLFGCDFWCEDDDGEPESMEDQLWNFFFFDCSECSTSESSPSPSSSKNSSSSSNAGLPPNIMISPPTTPLNVTVTQEGSSWFLNFLPWGGSGNADTPATTTTTTTTTTVAPAAANGTAANDTTPSS